MILKQLEIRGYGPFLFPTKLEVDENVTVLTGQNDVGKSAILQLIQLLCGASGASEDHQNFDHKYTSGKSWNEDQSVTCIATFSIDGTYSRYFRSPSLQAGLEVDVEFSIT